MTNKLINNHYLTLGRQPMPAYWCEAAGSTSIDSEHVGVLKS
jgi:hypothetical protein